MPETTAPTTQRVASLHEAFATEQARLRTSAKRLAAAAAAIGPLTKSNTWDDLKRLEKTLPKIVAKLDPDQRRAAGLEELLTRADEHLREAPTRLKRELGRSLPELCREAGLEFSVVSREDPLELRIPPFGVVLDLARGQARLTFARAEVATCAAEARTILESRAKVLAAFEKGFEPAAFFDRAHRAWRAARATRGDKDSSAERVEIVDFLPYLALEMQAPRFRSDPIDKNYRGYGRAQFAYHILLLRQHRMLTRDGLRLNLGVASGTTAQQKKRVIYFEDARGDGEYKLTVFFSRIDEGHRR